MALIDRKELECEKGREGGEDIEQWTVSKKTAVAAGPRPLAQKHVLLLLTCWALTFHLATAMWQGENVKME